MCIRDSIHAINTIHDQILSGEILRRREQTGAGAGVMLPQLDGQTAGDTKVESPVELSS